MLDRGWWLLAWKCAKLERFDTKGLTSLTKVGAVGQKNVRISNASTPKD